ncbi:MAG: hypothetical protein KDA05_10990 [Phycisphaerales bacterium]|nr:hypothetical protein [Phycisphaerales bacterium]MCB9840123.1 hypothetical protein [Phycisphaeraceae bacterium]
MATSEPNPIEPPVSEALKRVWRWREEAAKARPLTPAQAEALRREFGLEPPSLPEGHRTRSEPAKKSA